MSDPEVDVREFCSEARLEPMILRGEYFSDQAREVGMAEVSLIPESRLLGKSIREVAFRSRYGLSVVGIRRSGEALTGKLVDEPALIAALKAGKIAGAALDVYEREPLPAEAAILSAPNTLLTPHLGYATRETYEIYFPQAVEDIEAWLAAKPVRVIS